MEAQILWCFWNLSNINEIDRFWELESILLSITSYQTSPHPMINIVKIRHLCKPEMAVNLIRMLFKLLDTSDGQYKIW